MATKQDLEAALADLKQAIADAAARVIEKLNNLGIPEEDIADIRTDIESLAAIANDAGPAAPANPGPDLANVNTSAQTREEQAAGAGPGTLPDVRKEQAQPEGQDEPNKNTPNQVTEEELPGQED